MPEDGPVKKLQDGDPLTKAALFAMDRGTVPDWLYCLDTPLSSGQERCYLRLLRRVNAEGRCWPKQGTLAKELRCSERYVKGLIQELEGLGLIRVERTGRQNVYVLLWREDWMSLQLDGDQNGANRGTPDHLSRRKRGTTVHLSDTERGTPDHQSPANRGTPDHPKGEPQFPSQVNHSSPVLHEEKQGRESVNIAKQHAAGQASEAECLSHAAAAALSEIGAGEEVFAELSRLPGGDEAILLWVREIGPLKPKWSDPKWLSRRVGFVRSAVRGTCTDPTSGWRREAEDFKARKREAAAEAEKQGRRKQEQAAAKSAKSGSSVAIGDAVQPWRNFLALVNGQSSGLYALLNTRPRSVERDGDTLLVAVPPECLTQLTRDQAFLAQLARKANPDCPGVRFIPTGSGNLSATADTHETKGAG